MLKTEELLQKISTSIKNLSLDGKPVGLYQPIEYSLGQSGKRIRPLLVLLSTQLFGGDTDEALPAATAIEIFHNFTLLHDDIIDKAPLRRGFETVYQKWNTNVAILSGDTMFAIAYGELAKSNPVILPKLMQVFTKTAIEVCEGQQYDIDFEEMDTVTLPEYVTMIKLKTAVLLAASMQIGALIANASDKDAKNIYDFGINLGIAFQLQDDLLDAFGNQNVFGKQTGGDIATNKKTVLYIKALEKADNKLKIELTNLYSNQDIPINDKIERVLNIFRTLDVKQETEKLISSYFETAINLVNSLNISREGKQLLLDLANGMLNRER